MIEQNDLRDFAYSIFLTVYRPNIFELEIDVTMTPKNHSILFAISFTLSRIKKNFCKSSFLKEKSRIHGDDYFITIITGNDSTSTVHGLLFQRIQKGYIH